MFVTVLVVLKDEVRVTVDGGIVEVEVLVVVVVDVTVCALSVVVTGLAISMISMMVVTSTFSVPGDSVS